MLPALGVLQLMEGVDGGYVAGDKALAVSLPSRPMRVLPVCGQGRG